MAPDVELRVALAYHVKVEACVYLLDPVDLVSVTHIIRVVVGGVEILCCRFDVHSMSIHESGPGVNQSRYAFFVTIFQAIR